MMRRVRERPRGSGGRIIVPESSYRGREKEVARRSCSPVVGGCGLTKVVRPYALVVCSLEQVTRNWRECQVLYITFLFSIISGLFSNTRGRISKASKSTWNAWGGW